MIGPGCIYSCFRNFQCDNIENSRGQSPFCICVFSDCNIEMIGLCVTIDCLQWSCNVCNAVGTLFAVLFTSPGINFCRNWHL